MGLVLGIDFDETLVDQGPLRWRPYAKEAMLALKRAGHTLVLHSGRATPIPGGIAPGSRLEADAFWRNGSVPTVVEEMWQRFVEMRAFLQAEGVWDLFEVWQRPGKPHVDRFYDDRAEVPNWGAVWAELVDW